jgi:anti-repressor protein
MNDLSIFKHNVFGEVRTVTRDGNPWFVAADVCRALEIANSRDALTRLDDDEKGVALTDTPGGRQQMSIVSEPGLYTLVLGSRKPEARAFKRWVAHDVIPAIRKHGMYAVDHLLENPDLAIAALTRLKEERERRKALEAQAAIDSPKVLFADSVAASEHSILVGELAKLLRQNGVKVGQNRLFEYLREEGFLCKAGDQYNMPTQRSMEMGLFEIKERTLNNPDGSVRLTRTSKVTGKGQIYFINRLRKERRHETWGWGGLNEAGATI